MCICPTADFTNSRMAISAVLYEKWHLSCNCRSTPSPCSSPMWKTSPERLRTHAVDYAGKPRLHEHISTYRRYEAVAYLEKAETDRQMERRRYSSWVGTVGRCMDCVTNARFDDSGMSSWYTVPLHYTYNTASWSCQAWFFMGCSFLILCMLYFFSPAEKQMCGNNLRFKLQGNGIYDPCSIQTTDLNTDSH